MNQRRTGYFREYSLYFPCLSGKLPKAQFDPDCTHRQFYPVERSPIPATRLNPQGTAPFGR